MWSAAPPPPPQQQQPPPDMLNAAGGSFSSQYTLQTRLGDGMTACVYIAREKATGELFACKLAERKQHRSVWGRLSQLIRRESALLQEIGQHPCLVQWRGFYESAQEVAIVMEIVGGGDCQQLLQRHGCLAEPMVQPMVCQLHSALRCATPL